MLILIVVVCADCLYCELLFAIALESYIPGKPVTILLTGWVLSMEPKCLRI